MTVERNNEESNRKAVSALKSIGIAVAVLASLSGWVYTLGGQEARVKVLEERAMLLRRDVENLKDSQQDLAVLKMEMINLAKVVERNFMDIKSLLERTRSSP